jgi:hypothetical protein
MSMTSGKLTYQCLDMIWTNMSMLWPEKLWDRLPIASYRDIVIFTAFP